MRAYGLTSREQDVTRQVLRGRSTKSISRELSITGGTVQAHVRNIFERTGVRSRHELVAVAFRRHYEPRIRDNERRTRSGLPSRHGPGPADHAVGAGRRP
ncbi:response regulator transcription factor [Blastococcus sp. PRF04-17]|uniref:response regulator transcription factor n=1 Tax=Blastococcus sp. PRF04-17 TaxID=2933797 RepID=UPI0035302951